MHHGVRCTATQKLLNVTPAADRPACHKTREIHLLLVAPHVRFRAPQQRLGVAQLACDLRNSRLSRWQTAVRAGVLTCSSWRRVCALARRSSALVLRGSSASARPQNAAAVPYCWRAIATAAMLSSTATRFAFTSACAEW